MTHRLSFPLTRRAASKFGMISVLVIHSWATDFLNSHIEQQPEEVAEDYPVGQYL